MGEYVSEGGLLLLCVAAALAGCVDAIVGGGGLIQVPALFGVFPNLPAASLLATNKAASIWGTSWAFVQYARRVSLRWATLVPAALAAALGAYIGAWGATCVPSLAMRLALPWVLLALLLYTLLKPKLGRGPLRPLVLRHERAWSMAIGLVIGAYDGLFGPGTGSFFVFAGVRLLGQDFLHASAQAKLLNAATNAAALGLFMHQGLVLWAVALPMAAANVLGSTVGTRMALRHGAGFVRGVFIVVVLALICRTGWDAWNLLRSG
jgi:uncharacterized membrane protein YfcA